MKGTCDFVQPGAETEIEDKALYLLFILLFHYFPIP